MPEISLKFGGVDMDYEVQRFPDHVHIWFRVPSQGVSVTLAMSDEHADQLGRELVTLQHGEALVRPVKPRKPKGGT